MAFVIVPGILFLMILSIEWDLSEGEKKNDTFTKEDIIKWKNYEVDNMTEDLLTIDKPNRKYGKRTSK